MVCFLTIRTVLRGSPFENPHMILGAVSLCGVVEFRNSLKKTAEMSHFSCFFFLRLFQNSTTPHNGTPPQSIPRIMWGFSQGIFWGWSHSVGLSNFETVFKNSWKVTFQLFFLFKTVSKFDDPTQCDRPPNIPQIVWGFSQGGMLGAVPLCGVVEFRNSL